ncbi:MAG: TetR/AcrR family transcriptional regulator [Butyrivibrio sp.]|jgi:AcrR family transcriptional regulator|nr:TetR/AcrR family transcriptional regulator [Butyrivibrio sp.]
MNETQKKIMETVIVEFNKRGLKFTMDDIAKDLHMSKKTIYKEYEDKEQLFDHMVDFCFSSIKESEARIMSDSSLGTVEKVSRILIALPENYKNIDFRMIYQLKDKYPATYAKIEKRLESDWENTINLVEQGMKEGTIRKMSIAVLKAMVEASIEKFLSSDALIEGKIEYNDALQIMVDIIMNGITARENLA